MMGNPFEHEQEVFRRLLKQAPSAVGESIAELQDLAGVNPRYFDDHVRDERRADKHCMIAVLTAIIDTADERLRDVEGDHVARYIDNPYDLDSSRDLQRNLTEIVDFLRTSNEISQIAELEEASREHLIKICQTVIHLLQGEQVEVGFLKKCGRQLQKLGQFLTPVVASAAVSGAVSTVVATLLSPVPGACENSSDASIASPGGSTSTLSLPS